MLIGCFVAFLAFSYAPYFVSSRVIDLPGITLFWAVWSSTAIILCEAGCRHMGGYCVLAAITSSRKNFFLFLLTGTTSGVFLDGTAQWLTKLWVYPYWTKAFYWSCFIVGFSAYWLLLAETYFLAQCALRRLFSGPGRLPARRHPQIRTKRLFGATGLFLAVLGLLLAIHAYVEAGGYSFALRVPSAVHAPFYCFLLITAGAFLVLESIVSTSQTESLLEFVRRHDWVPLCAIMTAGWITGFVMETANAAHHFWVYSNWPLPHMAVCRVPALVLILWPVQYVVFLSIFHAFTGKGVWE